MNAINPTTNGRARHELEIETHIANELDATSTLPTALDLIRDLDRVSALGLGLYCRTVPVRPATGADLARIEAASINETIKAGGAVDWTRAGQTFRIEAACAIGAEIYFAFVNGCEVICRATADRAARDYSLTWMPRAVGEANDLVAEGVL